ncbi:MAG: hypothetical protein H6Q67_97 [Firmicutes bacterium]|nr:hypothetical protein [Bacillota bacterium]
MTVDLHIHTNCSDGIYSPEEIVEFAKAAGLEAIAITDHDTIDGVSKLLERSTTAKNMEVIPGIEFSTDLPDNEVHILGYYIDVSKSELISQLKLISEDRYTRTKKMVTKLNSLGYEISYDSVLKIAGEATSIGRPHIAAALIDAKYFSNVADVFDVLLEKRKPAYIPHYKMSPAETIQLIVRAGGVPVLAHPGLVGNDAIVMEIIALGIQGIEVYHPSHNPSQVSRYLQLATEHNLLVTGGSDFHGIAGRVPERLGEYGVSLGVIRKLKELSACKG